MVDRLDENGNQVILKSGRVSRTKKVTKTYTDYEHNINPNEALDVLYQILTGAKRVLMHNSEFDLNMLKFAPETTAPASATAAAPAATAAPAAAQSLADTERDQINAALRACRGNKTKAAGLLGISRRTLHRKLKEWGEG